MTDEEAGHRTAGGAGGEGPISKLCKNNRQILGPEWSMSKVGTPPTHNLDKTHGLVASINNNNNPMFDPCLNYLSFFNLVRGLSPECKFKLTMILCGITWYFVVSFPKTIVTLECPV